MSSPLSVVCVKTRSQGKSSRKETVVDRSAADGVFASTQPEGRAWGTTPIAARLPAFSRQRSTRSRGQRSGSPLPWKEELKIIRSSRQTPSSPCRGRDSRAQARSRPGFSPSAGQRLDRQPEGWEGDRGREWNAAAPAWPRVKETLRSEPPATPPRRQLAGGASCPGRRSSYNDSCSTCAFCVSAGSSLRNIDSGPFAPSLPPGCWLLVLVVRENPLINGVEARAAKLRGDRAAFVSRSPFPLNTTVTNVVHSGQHVDGHASCQTNRQLTTENKDGAPGRNRTGTPLSRRGILSPMRLPIPPPGQRGRGRS